MKPKQELQFSKEHLRDLKLYFYFESGNMIVIFSHIALFILSALYITIRMWNYKAVLHVIILIALFLIPIIKRKVFKKKFEKIETYRDTELKIIELIPDITSINAKITKQLLFWSIVNFIIVSYIFFSNDVIIFRILSRHNIALQDLRAVWFNCLIFFVLLFVINIFSIIRQYYLELEKTAILKEYILKNSSK